MTKKEVAKLVCEYVKARGIGKRFRLGVPGKVAGKRDTYVTRVYSTADGFEPFNVYTRGRVCGNAWEVTDE